MHVYSFVPNYPTPQFFPVLTSKFMSSYCFYKSQRPLSAACIHMCVVSVGSSAEVWVRLPKTIPVLVMTKKQPGNKRACLTSTSVSLCHYRKSRVELYQGGVLEAGTDAGSMAYTLQDNLSGGGTTHSWLGLPHQSLTETIQFS